MKLSILLSTLSPLSVMGGDPEIKGIAYDSRHVKPGWLFFALKGQAQDGNRFIQDAVERGAAALITDQAVPTLRTAATVVRVVDARQALAQVADRFHGRPSRCLKVVGITGTNGKTTTAFMTRDILAAAGLKPGLIGTVEYRIGDRVIPASRTTPESADLQAMLAQMAHGGGQSAVMEVSSHALVQHRVTGVDFDVAVFTNLTHDHLDYHETLDQYFQAKTLLFRRLSDDGKRARAVVNVDCPRGRELLGLPGVKAEFITYGVANGAQVCARDVTVSAAGSRLRITSPWGEVPLTLKLLGRFNISNALAAFATGGALGVDPACMVAALSALSAVPGRLEEIATGRGFHVFVDYAHTEDALRNVLGTLREITAGRLIVVFGCGGNRDRRKRPLMGGVAVELADDVIITSDNPRKENPSEIIAEIRAGICGAEPCAIIEDRQEAIFKALSMAEDGDTVLIAGKGHENYQEFTHTVIPFDDRQVARECLGIKG